MQITQEELDALPIMGEITYELREIDGRQVKVPKAAVVGALWQEPDEPYATKDRNGTWWCIGKAYGQTWKRRLR